ncbi:MULTISPECIES: YhcH/YjgK/YiaL family protein [Paenibacillus]|uniref:YhcH/YjgK/YiaL family protein n=1 Tax=Paenibacillus radicis (ex Xue et al. 2023) TaxID=2972489 RepID=A0ABT1YQJ7_9BACL|nr:YhcH/YjgK/YiaL family protein [Paenibacillus radicis (ex Xue et al. 2023)]MCR8635462.1 YhcH/YjgK/YiaL family protein [Paenibacillus radicis (ex Xue et al. 2023)]
MIISDIKNWEREKQVYPKAVNRGLEYIQSTDFSSLKPGRYDIEGDLMFALLQEPTTLSWEKQRPESHQTYTDIQFLLAGEEVIRVAPLTEDAVISEENFAARDIAFYSKIAEENAIQLSPGSFTVFYPGDIHRPCCSVSEDQPIRKVVIKIHKSLLFE